jgi:hypothetical protein
MDQLSGSGHIFDTFDALDRGPQRGTGVARLGESVETLEDVALAQLSESSSMNARLNLDYPTETQ